MDTSRVVAWEALSAWARQQQELVTRAGDADAAAAIDAAIAQLSQRRVVLAVLGKAKRGKSTLLNAMLGRRDDLVAPIDKLPASSAVTRFHWSQVESASVRFRDGRVRPILYRDIRDYVTEEANPGNRREVDLLDVSGPFPGLARDLILVDTPGAGSIHHYHDQIVQQFIPQADAVLYLVTARMPLDQDELDLLRAIKAADVSKIFFVINKSDATPEADLAAAEAHNRSALRDIGVSVRDMYRISAKLAFAGQAENSGMPALWQDIEAFLQAGVDHFLADRFRDRVTQAVQSVQQSLTMRLDLSARDEASRAAVWQGAADRKKSLLSQRTAAEAQFTHGWNMAIDAFEAGVGEAQRDADSVLQTRIDAAPLTGVGRLAKDLPGLITSVVEEQLSTYSNQLESRLREACTTLNASYPAIKIDSAGGVAVVVRKDQDALLQAGAGAALAGAGAGIAVAAGSAATAAAASAAAAAAPVAAAPGAALLGSVISFFFPAAASAVGALGAGAAPVAVAAPVAGLSWFVIAGPVGWAIAGLGVLAVPLAWRKHGLRTKEQVAQAAKDQVRSFFKHVRSERIPALRRMGTTILEGSRIQLESEVRRYDDALRDSDGSASQAKLAQWRELLREFAAAAAGPNLNGLKWRH